MDILSIPAAEDRKRAYRPAPDCTMVIFGAGGDLTSRLIVPALYNLAEAGMLPEGFKVIGVDLAELDDATWRERLSTKIHGFIAGHAGETSAPAFNDAVWDWLVRRLYFRRGDFGDPGTFERLKEEMGGPGTNVLFYLAVAERFFGPIVERLGASGLTDEGGEGQSMWRRVVIEKPFGHDLPSALALNRQILRVLREDQIFRMDHFLGKETVQNIMMLRFGNGAFEALWNRQNITHVEITAAETVGVEERGRFYEHAGALRDMIPNHLFQLLAVTAMEPPNSFDPGPVLTEKAKVLDAVDIPTCDFGTCAVRGQYGPGIMNGKEVPGYRQEAYVAPDSPVETYVALKLFVDNWRWAGVPFYLRTGKRMTRRDTEIIVHLRRPPFTMFRTTPVDDLSTNKLILHIQPDAGISFHFNAKIPGPEVHADEVRMDFRYKDFFQQAPGTGYEILLYDCMTGDGTLFQRADFVEAGWRIVQPILEHWSATPPNFPNYAAGSDGPAAADALLRQDGRSWRKL
jgi:glucose-6-phosphate 1-dehydrogenase